MSARAGTAGAKGIAALWARGWNEIPEVMGGCVKGAIGCVFVAIGLRNYYADDGDNRRFKQTYVVYRDTDPRAKTVRND